MQENNKSSDSPSNSNEETTLDLIAQNIDDIIWKLDIRSMRFLYISPSVESIRGFTPEEVLKSNVEDSCHPADLKHATAHIKKAYVNHSKSEDAPLNFTVELRQTKKEGGFVWLEVKVSLVIDQNGEPRYAIGVSRDISAKKKETSELKKSLEREKFFADIIRYSSQAIGIGYPNGSWTLLNQAAYDLLGYSEEELKHLNWSKELTPEKWQKYEQKLLKECVTNKKAITYKKEYIHKTGKIIPIELRVHPQFDDKGEINYFLAFISDISEIEIARVKLQQTNERFDLALKGANDGLWDWKIGHEKVYLSPRFLNMIGYEEGELDADLNTLLSFVHKEDINRVEQSQKEFVESDFERTEMQYRIKHKKGFFVPVLSRIFKLVDKNGTPVRMVGTTIDLTETLQMQQKIDESEARYKLLFENSNIGIAITNDDGQIIESNVTLKQMFEIPLNSVISYYSTQFYLQKQDRELFLELLAVTGEVRSFVFQGRKLDGKIIWVSMSSRKMKIDGEWRILNALTDITQQVISEQKLKESEERFKQLSLLTLEGILIHDNGHVLDVNQSFLRLSLYQKEELLNKDFYKLCLEKDVDYLDLFAELETSLQSKELQIRSKNGQLIPVEVSSRIARFKGRKVQVSSFHDISNRLEAESNIRKLSVAVEQSGHSIVITDNQGFIEYVNPQFVEVYEFGLLECLGKPLSIIDTDYLQSNSYDNVWQKINDGYVWKGEFLNKSKSGKEFWVSSTISPIKDREGNMTHFLSIMDDISQKKKFEKQLIEAKKNAEKSDQLKSAFLANMSHEIRTPLNGIIGFTELLNDSDERFSSQEITRYLSIISNNGQHLLHLVNDIIDISKIESGQMHISVQEFLLSEVLRKIENNFENSLKSSVELRIQYVDENILLKTDFTRLLQVFNNIISNALKFTDSGYVNVSFELEEQHLKVGVEDTGCGISEEAQKIIFDRFAQGRPVNDQLLGGTGLGLSITKGLVELLGGEVWVDSVVGEGSVFYFRILKNLQ